jgi:hypothetical protein
LRVAGAAAAAFGLALAAGIAASWGQGVDPTLPTTIVVGASAGACPMGRIDAARSGRARRRLPRKPRLLWRSSAQSSLDLVPVAVDGRGAVIVGSSSLPKVTQIGPDGARQWRASVGVGPPVTGPVLLSDGTRAVVTSAGEVVGLWPDGRPRFQTDLGLPGRNARVAPLPLEEGGIAVAVGAEVVILGGDGRLASRHNTGERIAGALVQTERGVVATSEDGSVFAIRPGHPVRELGSLGGDPGPGAAAPNGHTLAAVIDHRRLVTFDLRSESAETRYAANAPSIDGPIAEGPGNTLFFTDFAGTLLGYAEGSTRRMPLGITRPELVTDAGAVNLNAMTESPPLVTDDEGWIAFARVGGSIGVAAPSGATELAEGASCATPVALSPAGEGRMVVACRDGTLLMLGD